MTDSDSNLSRQRFEHLLCRLAEQGLTQREIAERVKIPSQYVSNIKNGHRPLTELLARRFGAVFRCNYEWLLGNSDEMDEPVVGATTSESTGRWVPVLDQLIEGDPQSNERWDGSFAELSGAAAARIRNCRHPYVLRCPVDDTRERVRQRDLLLISQEAREDAEIHVVRYRKRLFLVRIDEEGRRQRVNDGQYLAEDCVEVAHCTGIVWSSMTDG